MDHPDDWIWVQMSREGRHPHCWKELKTIYRDCLVGDLSNTHTLQLALQEAIALRLPLAQEESSGWWEAPCSLSTLHHWDFLPQKATMSPLNAQEPLSPKNQPSSLMLQVLLPLHPQHQTPVVTSPRTPGEPIAGLEPSAFQTLIQTAQMTGFVCT